MILIERNNEILNFIKNKNLCSIKELSSEFKISKVTVHRILNDLESEGIVQKVRGGVKYLETPGLEKSYDIRFRRQVYEKNQIARAAVLYIQEGSSIFIDSSTTAVYFAKEIVRSISFPVTIITDSPIIIYECLHCPYIQLLSTGGELQYGLNTFAGPLAFEAIEKLQYEKAFIGAAAVSLEKGIMTAQSVLVKLIHTIIAHAEEVNLLVDHTKFMKIAPLVIAPVTSVDRIISDSELSDSLVQEYHEIGVEIIKGK